MDWYLVITKLKGEPRVKQNLEANHQLECFFPAYPPRKASSPVGLPLFPRYVFVRCEPERDFPKIQYTPGVSRIVTFGETVLPVPDDVVAALKERCNDFGELKPKPPPEGSRVRVRTGLFEGFEGIIKEKRGNRRVKLLLDLAYGQVLDLDASEIEAMSSFL